MSLAISSVDSTVQKKIIELLSAMYTLGKRSLNLGDETPNRFVLEDIDEMIGDWWNCQYQPLSIFDLPSDWSCWFVLWVSLSSSTSTFARRFDSILIRLGSHPTKFSLPSLYLPRAPNRAPLSQSRQLFPSSLLPSSSHSRTVST